MNESKHKHLEMIQAITNRMAQNSFMLKGWTITILTALLAYASEKSKGSFMPLATIAVLPTTLFWILDAYYLSIEKQYRSLYEEVRQKTNDQIDYNLNPSSHNEYGNRWFFVSWTNASILLFYLPLIILPFIIALLIK